ncbi:MAG: PIN domain-containing protein [Thermodesulfobacteriota bacterium]
MKALDTNLLIRFLVKDDKKQAEAVYNIFKRAETNRESLFIPLLVVLEVVWVLESVYETTRDEILDSLEALLLMPILTFEAQPVLRYFTAAARESKVGLSDLLIASSARLSGCDYVLTFDRAASRSAWFALVNPDVS